MNTLRYSQHGLILMALLAVQAGSHAGPVDLSDTPLPVQSSVAPNILFMLDTSGSMNNIVPDSPYDPLVTYLASCPSSNTFSGGVAAPGFPTNESYDIGITAASVVTIENRDFGTDSGQRCFDPALRYNARLKSPVSDYLDTAYDGKFLNWYLCSNAASGCNMAANFGVGATRKPGTQTRMEIAKTAASTIINSLDTVRTGLARYNSATSGAGGELTVQMDMNNTTQKSTLNTAITGLSPAGSTLLAETLAGIGAYFAKGNTGNLTLHPSNPTTGMTPSYMNRSTATPSAVFGASADLRNGVSGTPTIAALIQYSCQKSFAVLMTDGRPQGDQSVSTNLCDYLGINGGCGSGFSFGRKSGVNGTGVDVGYHVNGGNKQLHFGDAHAYESEGSDYLDDVAGALFDIDLRPDLTKTGSQKNNVITYTIGFADLETISDPLMQEAAAAGGGLFSSAANASELVGAFQKAADDILAKDGSAAAVAVANAHVTNTDNASFATSYNSGVWTGDLIAYPINIRTGIPNIAALIWNTGCANPNAYVDSTDTTKGVLGCSAQVQLDLVSSASRRSLPAKTRWGAAPIAASRSSLARWRAPLQA